MNITPQPLDPAGDSGVVVRVGQREFSLREYQDLFAEITGGDSRLFKRFDRPVIVKVDDLKSFYQKLSHTISNFHPVGQTCKVSVDHRDDDFQEFKSFEAFLGYETGGQSPISGVTIEINFALRSPLDTKVTRAYSVKLLLFSQVSALQEGEAEGLSLVAGNMSALINVNYSDYTVALSCMAICETWLKNLPITEESKIRRAFYKTKPFSLLLFHLFFLMGSASLFFLLLGQWIFGPFNSSLESGVAAQVAVFSAIVVAGTLSLHQATLSLTRYLAKSFEYLKSHSIIVLNKADEQLVKWYDKKRKNTVMAQIFAHSAALAYSLIMKVCVEYILLLGR